MTPSRHSGVDAKPISRKCRACRWRTLVLPMIRLQSALTATRMLRTLSTLLGWCRNMSIKNSLRQFLCLPVRQAPAGRTHDLESFLDVWQAYSVAVMELHRLHAERPPRPEAIREFEILCRLVEERLMSALDMKERAGSTDGSGELPAGLLWSGEP